MAERSTDGLEGLGLKAVSDILPEPSEDGIDPVVHQGASWFDGVVKQRHRARRPFAPQVISGPRFNLRLVPFGSGTDIRSRRNIGS